MKYKGMAPQMRPSAMAPQKVLEGFPQKSLPTQFRFKTDPSRANLSLGGGGRKEQESAVPRPFGSTHFRMNLCPGIPPTICTRAP